MQQDGNANHEDNICLKMVVDTDAIEKCRCSLGNWLENYNSLERYFVADFQKWLEKVEFWKQILDGIVFQ